MLALRFTDFDPKRSLAGQHAYRDLWNIAGAGLVRFYVRELAHLLPLFDVVRDNPSEGGRRAPEHGTAQLRNPCDDFRVAEAAVGLSVELVDYLVRRIPSGSDPLPTRLLQTVRQFAHR